MTEPGPARPTPVHVLGVAAGPQPEPSPSVLAVPHVLAALADAGGRATVVTVDEVSAGLLATIGVVVPELPEVLLAGRLEVPAACGPALPVLSMWPLESVRLSATAGPSDVRTVRSTGVEEWRLRTESTAYSVHRTDPLALAVCGVGRSAGRSAALMLAAECAVPTLVILDAEVSLDGSALAVLDTAAAAWAPDDTAAEAWGRAVPGIAGRLSVVDVGDPQALGAAARALLGTGTVS
jgi:hypothetical protein